MGLPVRVREGCVFIDGQAGEMPISIVDIGSDIVQLKITTHIQTSPVESMELSQVIEDINRSDDGIHVDAPEGFSVRVQWVYEFSGEIENAPLIAGIGALSRTYELLNGSGKKATHFDYDLNLPNHTHENEMYVIIRDLTEHLLAALVDRFGDGVSVNEATAPEYGLVNYRFVYKGVVCCAEVTPYNDRWAVLSLVGCLGRVYRQHGAAKRWLARNRACNTVAIADMGAEDHELWVSANRNTLKGDAEGIWVELYDFCDEIGKMLTGLRLWFPQFIEAEAVEGYKTGIEADTVMTEAMENPRKFLSAMEKSNEALMKFPMYYAYLTRWLAEWEQNLRVNNSEPMQRLAGHNPQFQLVLHAARVRALRALRRYEELLNECLPSLPPDAISPARRAAIEAECLFESDNAEDALEAIQSADFDEDALVHFVRACACARLGRGTEALSHFNEYEKLTGRDMFAQKKLGTILQEANAEE